MGSNLNYSHRRTEPSACADTQTYLFSPSTGENEEGVHGSV